MRVLMAFLVLSAGCAGTATEPVVEEAAEPGVVRGVVVDEAIVPIEGVDVTLAAAEALATTTDAEGRFAFHGVAPGTYVVHARHPLHEAVQAVATVGKEGGEVVKIQMQRLFSQDPYTEPFYVQGFINCGYSLLLSAPCVIDYTMILFPGGLAPQLNGITGDVRRFVLPVGAGWQTMVSEITWEPSATGTTPALSLTASFFNRTSSHSYTGTAGPDPLRLQMDMDRNRTHPDWVGPEGQEDFLLFVNPSTAGSGLPAAVSIAQDFELFHHVFYYGIPPEGWSIVAGHQPPF